MEDGFRMILEGMGEDPNREGLIDTPKRVHPQDAFPREVR